MYCVRVSGVEHGVATGSWKSSQTGAGINAGVAGQKTPGNY